MDGLASTMIRQAAMTDSGGRKAWTVFDGPIDALWIENMNTVLDDNMTLCLANGERIKLKPDMRMLFEVRGPYCLSLLHSLQFVDSVQPCLCSCNRSKTWKLPHQPPCLVSVSCT